ncbi:carboxymuconolactone decarboxylase family protein [Methylocaldum sp.]|uniref:carboxymuconolactone decarboxylase family protein n=1 Tax=Methylocaldum sp. TaxID=1969727 RepID=UPI002D726839|nr:carboxymuconolactone decarboxylase family protein [Methylocaldum sp.]HYE37361.1 carboxymuconolactone decarboxylase family protein [Methylocaldum sp.]
MSWIENPPDDRYVWPIRLLFALQRRKFGRVLEPVKLWGRTPRVFFAFLRLYRTFERKSSPLEPSLRSLIMVRVSQINWCRFCVDLNASNALGGA